MSVPWRMLALAVLVARAACDNGTLADESCPSGLWGGLLEDWATGARDAGGRHGRVMALPPTKGYYVTERIDGPLMPPPLPQGSYGHSGPHGLASGSHGSASGNHGPASGSYGPNSVSHSGPHGPASGSHGPASGNHGPVSGSYGPNPGSHSGPHGPQSAPYGPNSGHSGPQSGPYGPNNSGPYGSNSHGHHSGSQGPGAGHAPPQPQPPAGYSQYDEWQATPPPPPPPGASKIVNRPPNPYKDKFKPSYQLQNPQSSQNQPIPVTQPWAGAGAADRVDAPPPAPQKQVSETDLYLLSAIEKLVYRVDLMEKRLRKMEDAVHYLVAGKEAKPEPCAGNFTRVGGGCYQVSAEAGDWKAASLRCRKLRAHLLELDAPGERRALTSALLADDRVKGKDFWTGGLNPGLLWIWAHSARPVAGNDTTVGANSTASAVSIVGEGRCLALVHDPALATYVYRGQDCALRHRYICEAPEERAKLSNDIERGARLLRQSSRRARADGGSDAPAPPH